MNTRTDIATLAQWLSPAFPVGAFAYSHGLETAMQAGVVCDADSLQDWLGDVIAHGSGRADCILLRAGFAADGPSGLAQVNDVALALCASHERREETLLQGAAFAQTVAAVWGARDTALCYPVAVGHAAAQQGFDVDLTASLYLHAFASNLVSAAVRAVPLGQTAGQRVMAALIALCDAVSQDTRGVGLEDLSSTAFVSDIAAMRHETLQPRIFRT